MASGGINMTPAQRLRSAIKNGMVTMHSNKSYSCNLCEKTLANEDTIKNHFKAKSHQQKEAEWTKGKNNNETNEDETFELDNNSPYNERFHCVICNMNLNSAKNYTEHRQGEKHQKKLLKEKESSPSTLHPPSNPVPPREQMLPQSKHNFHPVQMPYGVMSTPRGQVHIFSYRSFKEKLPPRLGADKDEQNIVDTFTDMGYKVFPHVDLTAKKTHDELEELTQDRSGCLQKVDALIIFFLSHGKSGHKFCSSDEKLLDLREIWQKFTNTNCPSMKGKPKIFFTNYCRGKKEEVEYDHADIPQGEDPIEFDKGKEPPVEVPMDIVTIFASTEDICVTRNKVKGTPFVRCLCSVLQMHAQDFTLHELFLLLDEKVKHESHGRNPEWVERRFYKFYFNPNPPWGKACGKYNHTLKVPRKC